MLRPRCASPALARSFLFAALLAAAPSAASAKDDDVEFRLVDAKNQPVSDAVVSLTPLDQPAPLASAAPAVPPEIVQRHQEFFPYVTAIRTGTAVRFPNRDTVQHHVYSLSKPKKFELPLYDPGKAETIVFDQPGVVVIGCNIHDWMLAYVVILDTPWFAVTPTTGAVILRAIPPGRYRAEVWHPRLKDAVKSGLAASVQRELTLAPAAPALSPSNVLPPAQSFTLALEPDRRIRRSPATSGGGYK